MAELPANGGVSEEAFQLLRDHRYKQALVRADRIREAMGQGYDLEDLDSLFSYGDFEAVLAGAPEDDVAGAVLGMAEAIAVLPEVDFLRAEVELQRRGLPKNFGTKLRRARTDVQKRIRPVPRENGHAKNFDAAFKLTDVGNGERLVSEHGKDLRYCHPQRMWYVYDGRRWADDTTAEINRRAIGTVRGLYEEAAGAPTPEQRAEIAKHALKSEATARIKALIEAASWIEGVPVNPDELDVSPWLLNVENGTLELKTGILRAHRREDAITKLAPVTYDPAAKCPTWYAFLDRIMGGDEDLIGYLRRAVGYALTGSTGEQVMPILHGSGANGKSTFIETIAALLGDYAQQTPTETLMVRHSQGVPNDLARLRGARFVSAVETGEGNRLAENLVKQMTGGDRITARFLHKEFFEFTPVFKLFLATNHKPLIRGTDEAIWRRLHLVPFSVAIPKPEQDPALKDKLKAELPGILNWALEGCLEWQKSGLQPPARVQAATQSYRDEMDVLAAFIEEQCTTKAGASVLSSHLHRCYREWCEANGEYAVSNKAFSMRLQERGFEKKRLSAGMFWEGLGLLSGRSDDEV